MSTPALSGLKASIISEKDVVSELERVSKLIVTDRGKIRSQTRDKHIRPFQVMVLIKALQYLAGNTAGSHIPDVHWVHAPDLGSQRHIANRFSDILILTLTTTGQTNAGDYQRCQRQYEQILF